MANIEATLNSFFNHEPLPPYYDKAGNLWIHSSETELELSLINGLVPQKGVLTAQGRQLLKRIPGTDFLRSIIDCTVHKDTEPFDKGYEGEVRKVFEPTSEYFSDDPPVVAVEKRFFGAKEKKDCSVPPLAWEVVELIQSVRRPFESAGINLVQPYGATRTHMYTPYVEGINLRKFLEGHSRDLATPLFAAELYSVLNNLQRTVITEVKKFMTEKGFPIVYEKTLDRETVRMQPVISNRYPVVLVDVSPCIREICQHDYSSFRNYMVPQFMRDNISDLIRRGRPFDALDAILPQLQCVDAVLLRGCTLKSKDLDGDPNYETININGLLRALG